ncbi:MAG TPA: hypothetical protein VFV50_19195 [Bdellovibrionales bacterium]|nr:hypothetical protein [Bdellovibrionales bacterium]
MSYVLEFVHDLSLKDFNSAQAFIDSELERYYAEEAEPAPAFEAFIRGITKKFPDDGEPEDSPWADAPIRGNFKSKIGMVSLVSVDYPEVYKFIILGANYIGLSVLDPQLEVLYHPHATEYPRPPQHVIDRLTALQNAREPREKRR